MLKKSNILKLVGLEVSEVSFNAIIRCNGNVFSWILFLGNVVLHKLILKQSALDSLVNNLPVNTTVGHIGV